MEENMMTHACGCHPGEAHGARTTATGPIRADQLVGQITRDCAGALEVMKSLGINHCCGAGLTLAEAATAAGVCVRRVLDALNGCAGSTP
jgi:hypothetical protein